MLRLKNNTGTTSKPGYIAVIDPKDNTSFIYASSSSTSAIGVVVESVPYRAPCNIATHGETANVYVTETVNDGDIIRSKKSTDNIANGCCKKVRNADNSYLKIGTAITGGSGLVKCLLRFEYSSSGTSQESITTVTSSYSVGSSDRLIVCNSATAITITLPTAVGSGRVIEIANINTGEITVEGYGSDHINGEDNQPIYEDNCMVIRDYANNNWVII